MSHNTIIFIYTFTVIIFPAIYVSCIISYRNKASYKGSFKLLVENKREPGEYQQLILLKF